MTVKNCTHGDLPIIQELYQAARTLQMERKMVVWPAFTDDFLRTEIDALRQFKIEMEGEVVCNWAITFSDKEIWGEKDLGDSLFIHRICTHPAYRGQRFIDCIVEWARHYARAQHLKYIRLDTLGQNDKLIKHYTSAGFDFLGIYQLSDTKSLPRHYQDEPHCCLFEIRI